MFRPRLNRAVWLVIRTVVVTEEKLLNADVLDGMMLAGSDSLNTIQKVRDTPRGEECAAIISTSAASGHLAQLRVELCNASFSSAFSSIIAIFVPTLRPSI